MTKDSEDYISTLFVSPRNTSKEIWEGVRLGVEGALDWPVNNSESIDDFEIRFAKLTKEYQNIFSISGVSKKLDNLLRDQNFSNSSNRKDDWDCLLYTSPSPRDS